MEMLGHRPPRQPKKRPRIVQRQLDSLFPGLWLTEVTADAYKVPETAETEIVMGDLDGGVPRGKFRGFCSTCCWYLCETAASTQAEARPLLFSSYRWNYLYSLYANIFREIFRSAYIGARPDPLWKLLSEVGLLYALEPIFTVIFGVNMNTVWQKVMSVLRAQIFRMMLLQKVFVRGIPGVLIHRCF